MESQNKEEAGTTKRCSVCGIVKPASEFYATRKSSDGLHSRCKPCHIAAAIRWQGDHRESHNFHVRRYKAKDQGKTNASGAKRLEKWPRHRRSLKYRRDDLRRNYGVTPEWYVAKLAEQGGGCAICGRRESGTKKATLHVDHCHATDETRGILCHWCNVLLERIESNQDWAKKAETYLAHYARTPRDTAVDQRGSDEPGREESLWPTEFPSDLGWQQDA